MLEREVVRRAMAVGVGLLSFVAAANARAEIPKPSESSEPAAAPASGERVTGPRLEWRAPADCPARETVLAQVAALAAEDAVSWARFELIRGVVEPTVGGWKLALEFEARDSVRRRSMQSANCSELADAAAVAIVLAHRSGEDATLEWQAVPATTAAGAGSAGDGAPAGGAPVSSDAPISSPPSAGSEGVEAAPRPELAVQAGAPVALSAGAEAMLDPTTLGAAAFGAGLGVELRSGAWSAALYGAWFPSVTSQLGAGQAIAIGLYTGGLRGCRHWGRGLDTCAGFELGQVSAEGVGLAQASEGHDLWAAPALSAGLASSPFDGFAITTRISAFLPLVRGQFRVDESEIVHGIPVVGFRAAVGVDVPLL